MKKAFLIITVCIFAVLFISCSSDPKKSGESVDGNIFYIYSGSEKGTISVHTNGVVLIDNGDKEIKYTFFDKHGKRLETKHADIVGGINLADDDFGLADACYYKVSHSDKKDHFFVFGDKVIKKPDERMCWSKYTTVKEFTVCDENIKNPEYVTSHTDITMSEDDLAKIKNFTSRDIGTGRANTELLMSIPQYMEDREGLSNPSNAKTVWKILSEERKKNKSLNDWFVPSIYELEELVEYVGNDNWNEIVSVDSYTGVTTCWSSSAYRTEKLAYNVVSNDTAHPQLEDPRWNGSNRDLAPKNGACFVLIKAF